MGIKLKRSAVASKVPATNDLELGELGVNTYDGKLFLKKNVGGTESIVEVGPVASVAGKMGVVTLAKTDVGLGNVDNTSDANKPVSTATQAALNGKANSSHSHVIADVTSLQTALDGKAPLTSPALIGTPTAPSAAAYADSTQIATTAQVHDTVTTVPENAQTGTAYTLVLADAGKLVTLNNAAAVTLSIPTNASVAFPIGTRIDLLQYGAGQVTIGGAGVTIRSSGSKLKLTGQYSGATLWKKGPDEWMLIGDITS
jgi:hypothetical protein